jgi:hypothetical protein
LDFAIVHLAIYDAVESIERRYEPYYTLAPGAIGSPSAAAGRGQYLGSTLERRPLSF